MSIKNNLAEQRLNTAALDVLSVLGSAAFVTSDLPNTVGAALTGLYYTGADSGASLTLTDHASLARFIAPNFTLLASSWSISRCGLTSFDVPIATINNSVTLDLSTNALSSFAVPASVGYGVNLNLATNSFPSAEVTRILAAWLASGAGPGGSVNISGTGNGAPLQGVTSMQIDSPGAGYSVGDSITGSSGTFLGSVTAVDPDGTTAGAVGALLSVSVASSPNEYAPGSPPALTIVSAGGGNGGAVSVNSMANSDVAALSFRGVSVTTN